MLITNWLTQWRARRELIRSRRPRRTSNRPHFGWHAECLEARTLLSNIAITAQNGVLKLVGDAENHTVAATVVSGNLHLVGSNGTTFTFNGATNATVDVPLSGIGSISKIQIVMQKGDDSINFDATGLGTVAGDVDVNLGDGTNALVFDHATITGKLAVTGGNGADSVLLTSDSLEALVIKTGAGDDTVHLTSVTLTASGTPAHGGSLVVDTGRGHDTVTFDTVTGAPSNSGGSWVIRLGAGADTAALNSVTTHDDLLVRGGRGDDTVTTTSSTFGGEVNVKMGLGRDQIHVNTSTFNGAATLKTGLGKSQSISVDGSTFNSTARFLLAGKSAQLNLESTGSAGAATVFHGAVFVRLLGPAAVVNFANPSSTDTLTFDDSVTVIGWHPHATVNIATARTTIDNNKLKLIRAKRNNV